MFVSFDQLAILCVLQLFSLCYLKWFLENYSKQSGKLSALVSLFEVDKKIVPVCRFTIHLATRVWPFQIHMHMWAAVYAMVLKMRNCCYFVTYVIQVLTLIVVVWELSYLRVIGTALIAPFPGISIWNLSLMMIVALKIPSKMWTRLKCLNNQCQSMTL